MYDNYEETKGNAYKVRSKTYQRLIEVLPAFLIKRLFPVVNFINPSKNLRVLDVGSGSGLYSFILNKKFDCDCIEVEPFLNNYYGNTQVIKHKIENFIPSGSYDLILLIDVIEHFDFIEAQKIILKLKQALKTNGALIIKVPNAGSLSGLESCFGDLTHKTHYNLVSLSALVNELGLTVLKAKGISSNFNFFRLIMRLFALPYILLVWCYLKSHGCSGILTSPSIMIRVRTKN